MTSLLLLQAHAHIVSYLKQEMPTIFCKESKKHNLIYDLPLIFTRIQQQHQVPAGDFPDCTKMQVRFSWSPVEMFNQSYSSYVRTSLSS